MEAGIACLTLCWRTSVAGHPLFLRHSGLGPESSPPRVCGAEEFFAIKDLIALDTGTRPV